MLRPVGRRQQNIGCILLARDYNRVTKEFRSNLGQDFFPHVLCRGTVIVIWCSPQLVVCKPYHVLFRSSWEMDLCLAVLTCVRRRGAYEVRFAVGYLGNMQVAAVALISEEVWKTEKCFIN